MADAPKFTPVAQVTPPVVAPDPAKNLTQTAEVTPAAVEAQRAQFLTGSSALAAETDQLKQHLQAAIEQLTEAKDILQGLVRDSVLEDGFMTNAVGTRLIARGAQAKIFLEKHPAP